MLSTRYVAAGTLAILIFLHGGCSSDEAQSGDNAAPDPKLVQELEEHIRDPDRLDPEQPRDFIGEVRQSDAKPTADELMDLMLAYALLQKWEEGADTFGQIAGGLDDEGDRRLKAVALNYQARLMVMTPDDSSATWSQAGELMNRASRLVPENPELVAERYWIWSAAGDELEAEAAKSRLSQMNIELEGDLVFEPMTVAGIAIVTAGAITIYAIHKGLLDAEDVAWIVGGMIKIAIAIIGRQALAGGDVVSTTC